MLDAGGTEVRLGARIAALAERPPGWVFHSVVAVTLVLLLWATSAPGTDLFVLLLAMALLVVLTIAWGIRLLARLTRLGARAAGRQDLAFLVAPAMVLVGFGLASTDAPLRVRWSASRAAFEEVVATAPAPGDGGPWAEVPAPDRVGSYDVFYAHRVDEAIFFQTHGGLFDDVGFACLPNGPTPSIEAQFESLQVEHLDGCWYSWSSSW